MAADGVAVAQPPTPDTDGAAAVLVPPVSVQAAVSWSRSL